MPSATHLSIVIATHNRRDVIVRTLGRLVELGDELAGSETIVVDNASTDGTADAITERFARVRLVRLNHNAGSCGKAFGTERAVGDTILFLDDDSYPHPGSVRRMLARFNTDNGLGAAGFCVHLSDGGAECSALPGVFVGCGVGLRAEAYHACGGLDGDLFMQAEEYDLCFRLAAHGWRTAVFDDLHVHHDKTPRSRSAPIRAYRDTLNNLLVAVRYIPAARLAQVFDDWALRYRWHYADPVCAAEVDRAVIDGRARRRRDRAAYATARLSALSFERYFGYGRIATAMQQLRCDGVRRVLLAGLGKNVYPFVAGARQAGLAIMAIADGRYAAAGRCYRGIAIVDDRSAGQMAADAVVVSDTSRVHGCRRALAWRSRTTLPVYAPGVAGAGGDSSWHATASGLGSLAESPRVGGRVCPTG